MVEHVLNISELLQVSAIFGNFQKIWGILGKFLEKLRLFAILYLIGLREQLGYTNDIIYQ